MADVCAPNGRLASHISWMGLSSRCQSWCSNLSLVKATAFPSWMPQCLCSMLGTETMSSLSVFAGGDEGTSVLVTQKQKVAFKMLGQEKQRTKRHLSVKMKESLFLPSTMMKLFVNSSYFSVSDTHRTLSSCSLKILLGSVKCSCYHSYCHKTCTCQLTTQQFWSLHFHNCFTLFTGPNNAISALLLLLFLFVPLPLAVPQTNISSASFWTWQSSHWG